MSKRYFERVAVICAALFVASLVLYGLMVWVSTAGAQGGTTTVQLGSLQDTFIYSKYSTTNYGSRIDLLNYWNGSYRGVPLLDFDLSAVSGQVVSARLWVYQYAGAAPAEQWYIYYLNAPWDQYTATWSGDAGKLASLGDNRCWVAEGTGWRSCDMTALVSALVEGTVTGYGIGFRSVVSIREESFVSNDHASTQLRAYLEVEFEPEPTVTPTPMPVGTPVYWPGSCVTKTENLLLNGSFEQFEAGTHKPLNWSGPGVALNMATVGDHAPDGMMAYYALFDPEGSNQVCQSVVVSDVWGVGSSGYEANWRMSGDGETFVSVGGLESRRIGSHRQLWGLAKELEMGNVLSAGGSVDVCFGFEDVYQLYLFDEMSFRLWRWQCPGEPWGVEEWSPTQWPTLTAIVYQTVTQNLTETFNISVGIGTSACWTVVPRVPGGVQFDAPFFGVVSFTVVPSGDIFPGAEVCALPVEFHLVLPYVGDLSGMVTALVSLAAVGILYQMIFKQ